MISNFKLVPHIKYIAKFRSKCAKTKKKLCPELMFACRSMFLCLLVLLVQVKLIFELIILIPPYYLVISAILHWAIISKYLFYFNTFMYH